MRTFLFMACFARGKWRNLKLKEKAFWNGFSRAQILLLMYKPMGTMIRVHY